MLALLSDPARSRSLRFTRRTETVRGHADFVDVGHSEATHSLVSRQETYRSATPAEALATTLPPLEPQAIPPSPGHRFYPITEELRPCSLEHDARGLELSWNYLGDMDNLEGFLTTELAGNESGSLSPSSGNLQADQCPLERDRSLAEIRIGFGGVQQFLGPVFGGLRPGHVNFVGFFGRFGEDRHLVRQHLKILIRGSARIGASKFSMSITHRSSSGERHS